MAADGMICYGKIQIEEKNNKLDFSIQIMGGNFLKRHNFDY